MGGRTDPYLPRTTRGTRRLIRAGAACAIAVGVLAPAPAAHGSVARQRQAVVCTQISTALQLQSIGLSTAALAGYYCLQNDIDLAALGTPFAPIGQTASTPFTGTFDGQGHTIANLSIAQSTSNPIGLFGALDTTATVENLHLTGISVAGGSNMTVGGLAGMSKGSVSGVDVAGTVSASSGSNLGGLIGTNSGSITGSHNTAAIIGTAARVGGLAGASQSGTIAQSYNTGPVTGTAASSYVGGLVGILVSGSVDQSYNSGPVVASGSAAGGLLGSSHSPSALTRSYNTGSVTGQASGGTLGGLIGTSETAISQSYSTGTISYPVDSASAGGLVGYSGAPISRSYHVGSVTGGTHSSIGGLVGREDNLGTTIGTISETYSAGAVTGSDTSDYIGGLIGRKVNSSVDNTVPSFFDFTACGCAYGTIGVGDRTSDMIAKSTYTAAGWDLTSTWNIDDGQSYPYFKWVLTAPLPAAPTPTVTDTATATAVTTATSTVTPSATSTMTIVPTSTPVPLVQQIIQLAPIANHRYGDAPFTATAMGGSSGNPVTFQTSGNCTATGANGSTISLTGAGSCTVRAYQAGNASYAAAEPVSETFTIDRGLPTVTWAKPANIRYGTRLGSSQLDARSPVAGSFHYSPAAGNMLQVGKNQVLRATFVPANGNDWEQAAASTTITVLQAIPRVVLARIPNHTYGDASFKVAVSGNTARTTTKYAVRGACRVGGSGGNVISLTGAGSCSVSAMQPGTKNYAAVSVAPVTFSIAKAKPAIAWAKKIVITSGTALGSGQLNARATFQGFALAGTYRYSPSFGTKLAVGTHTLRVTFTPRDGKDFVTGNASTTIVVLKR